MRRAILAAGLVLAGSLLLGGPAQAQMDSREGIALQNEILDLRHQLDLLQRNPAPTPRPVRGNGGGDDGGLTAQLLDRVSTLEDQVRQLRGQVDELTNQQQRQAADFAKQLGDLQFAMQNTTPSLPPPRAPGQTSPLAPQQPLSPPPSYLGGAVVPPTPAVPPPRTPEMALQEANAALGRRDYAAAIAAAREVLAKHGPRAADAQYVLAQAEMGQRNYQQAAPDFYDAYNRARTSPRAPDALLGVANSLIALNDQQSACEALAKLRTEFPQPRPDIREGELDARRRASCH